MSIKGFIFGGVPTPKEMEDMRNEQQKKEDLYHSFRVATDRVIRALNQYGVSVDDVMKAINKLADCYYKHNRVPKIVYIVEYNWITGMSVTTRSIN